jgi:hypothetical protein
MLQYLCQGFWCCNINARDAEGETPIFTYFRKGSAYHASNKNGNENVIIGVGEMRLFELFDHAGMDWAVTNRAGESRLHLFAAKDKHVVNEDAHLRSVRVLSF